MALAWDAECMVGWKPTLRCLSTTKSFAAPCTQGVKHHFMWGKDGAVCKLNTYQGVTKWRLDVNMVRNLSLVCILSAQTAFAECVEADHVGDDTLLLETFFDQMLRPGRLGNSYINGQFAKQYPGEEIENFESGAEYLALLPDCCFFDGRPFDDATGLYFQSVVPVPDALKETVLAVVHWKLARKVVSSDGSTDVIFLHDHRGRVFWIKWWIDHCGNAYRIPLEYLRP